jgi:hypothetical protein
VGTGQRSHAATAKAGVKRRAPGSVNAVGPVSLCEVRRSADHGRHETPVVVASAGVRRSRWRRSAREERPCCFEKRRWALPGTEDPMVPGQPKDERGRKQAISFLGILDGKTLKHTKTTRAENEVR